MSKGGSQVHNQTLSQLISVIVENSICVGHCCGLKSPVFSKQTSSDLILVGCVDQKEALSEVQIELPLLTKAHVS